LALASFPTRRSSDLRPGELGGQLGVQAVDVLPGELLGDRHDHGQLDRREADLASELVPANRLLGTLTVLQAGTATNLTGLREGRSEEHTSELQSREN